MYIYVHLQQDLPLTIMAEMVSTFVHISFHKNASNFLKNGPFSPRFRPEPGTPGVIISTRPGGISSRPGPGMQPGVVNMYVNANENVN